jgi:hypothetical protein
MIAYFHSPSHLTISANPLAPVKEKGFWELLLDLFR